MFSIISQEIQGADFCLAIVLMPHCSFVRKVRMRSIALSDMCSLFKIYYSYEHIHFLQPSHSQRMLYRGARIDSMVISPPPPLTKIKHK